MRRLLAGGILLLTGCQSVVGPRQRCPEKVDNPYLTIDQQKRLARDQLAFPEQTPILPRTYAELPTNANR